MKPTPTPLGSRLRALRLNRGLSLAELARDTGTSEATLSRIETGASQPSAPHLYALAQRLEVDIASFFTEGTRLRPGARSHTPAGQGQDYHSPRLTAQILNGDLLHKRMTPFRNRTTARTVEEAGGLAAHPGEEWLHVLHGTLILHTDAFAPLRLSPGDSLYFDATTPHAYLAEGEGAEFLVVTSAQPSGQPAGIP